MDQLPSEMMVRPREYFLDDLFGGRKSGAIPTQTASIVWHQNKVRSYLTAASKKRQAQARMDRFSKKVR